MSAEDRGESPHYTIGSFERNQEDESEDELPADVFLSITRPSSRTNTRHERVTSSESTFSEICTRVSQRFQDALFEGDCADVFVRRASTPVFNEESPPLASGFHTPETGWSTNDEIMDFGVHGDDSPIIECILPIEGPEDEVMEIMLEN